MTPGSLPARAAALALLALVIAMAVFGVVLPVQSHLAAQDESLARSQDALRRYQREIADFVALRARGEALGQGGREADVLLTGSSEAVAASLVQRAVKSAVEKHQGSLETIQIAETEEAGTLTRVGVRVRARLTIDMVQRVLHAVETGSPYLFVDGLTIRHRQTPSPAETVPDPELDVLIDVYGLWAGPPDT